MRLPGFTAEAALDHMVEGRYALSVRWTGPTDPGAIEPQFHRCFLYRFCIPIPPYGIPYCFYREFCSH